MPRRSISLVSPVAGRLALAAGAALVLLGVGVAQATPALTNATLFDAGVGGSNSQTPGNQITNGAWTSVLDQQNIPGNYGGEFFLSKLASPTAADFLSPSLALSAALSEGANTFYFWADGDDLAGGTAGFGLNLFLDGAATTAPSISAFTTVGGLAVTDAAACTAGYTFNCVTGAGTFSFVSGASTITLSGFEVFARGGGSGGEDRVGSTFNAPFTPPPMPDGINDTYGRFTLTVTTPEQGGGGVPEPASWALMIGGMGLAGASLRSRRRSALLTR